VLKSCANDEKKNTARLQYADEYTSQSSKMTKQDRTLSFNLQFGKILIDAATNTVSDIRFDASARSVLTKHQQNLALIGFLFLAVSLTIAQSSTVFLILLLCSSFFLLNSLFKLCLLAQIDPAPRGRAKTCIIKDNELPTITILIPLYKEAATLPSIINALNDLDYPKQKLDIKFVFEEDDLQSIEEAKRLIYDENIDIIVTPNSTPKTKPKACNYALFQASGEITVIYDAEDVPEPHQLRKAAAAFLAGGPKLACVQARLNYYNSDENWLTGLFSLEYYLWFCFFLPGLQMLGAPIPLGGTSNFIRTKILRELGAWDAFNVTEDADLGLRLARAGYKTQVIDSETLEEATCTVHSWIKQRTRWIKGHLQTWLVHLRMETAPINNKNWSAHAAVHLFLAGNFVSALITPPLWLLFCLSIGSSSSSLGNPEQIAFNHLAIFIFCFAYLSALSINIIAALANKRRDLLPLVLIIPLYWILNSIAAYLAVFELISNPFYWSKTSHVQKSVKSLCEKTYHLLQCSILL